MEVSESPAPDIGHLVHMNYTVSYQARDKACNPGPPSEKSCVSGQKCVSNGSSVCDIYSNSIHRGGESAQFEHSEHIGKGQTTEN